MPILTGIGYTLFGAGAVTLAVKVLTTLGFIPHIHP